MIWFTSDTHFGHTNAIKYCKRPFQTVEEMDKEIINRWNSCVQPEDHVYHLGDISFKNKDYTENILKKLNGQKFLVRGNHDKHFSEEWLCKYFAWVKDLYTLEYEKTPIVLCHYPLRTWEKIHHGSVHLFGHCHGNQKLEIAPSMDVGVDCWNYYPINILKVKELLFGKQYTATDHH